MAEAERRIVRVSACAVVLVVFASAQVSPSKAGEVTKAFNEWFRSHAAVHDKVEVAEYENFGRGIVTLKPIKKNELVMSFPISATMSEDSAKASAIGSYITPNVKPTNAIVVQLMYEKANLEASDWKAWIQALPQTIETAMTATDMEISEVQDTEAENEIKQARADLKEDYFQIRQTMFQPHPNVFPKERYNWETYRWARLMVDSRCWSLQGRRVCMPGGDFFNFGVSEEQLDPNSNLLGHFFVNYHKLTRRNGVEVVEIYSDRDAQPGEHLVEAYGESSNTFLSSWFGFAPIPNPSDFVRLKWQFKPGRGSHSDEKLAMLNLFRGEVQTSFKLRMLDVLPDHVLWYLKVTTLPSNLMAKCSRVADKAALLECLKPHNTPAMYDEILELLEEKLERYPTTIEADQTLLESEDIDAGRKLMIRVRMHHKMIAEHNVKLTKTLAERARSSQREL